ncbi:MAG: hypothetical protein ACFBRM_07765 [Pikeienuella sp.]
MDGKKTPLTGNKVLPWWMALGIVGAILVLYVLIDRAMLGADTQPVALIDMPPHIAPIDPQEVNYPVVNRSQADFLVPEGKMPDWSKWTGDDG